MNVVLRDPVFIRPLEVSDASALARAYSRNREYLQPWEPVRPDRFYTEEGQRLWLTASRSEQEAGRSYFWALFDGGTADGGFLDGPAVVGRISLTDVVRGAFQNGHVGYWIARDHQARGLATAALETVGAFARELRLHRLQAGTLVHNAASRKVLARNGFTEIGTAGRYLHINGRWQDHVVFQKILHD